MAVSPKVSVVVPVFNAANKILDSVDSLLNQSLDGLEIIIVNDGSSDCSGAIIDRLAYHNHNIVAVHFSENRGVHEARLAGLRQSTAPWIGFLDADDFVQPNMYEYLHTLANEQHVDIVVCGSYRVTAEHRRIAPKLRFQRSMRVESNTFERFCAFEFGTGSLCNKLYRRDVIAPYANMHFPWRQDINEDLLLNIGCFYRAKSVYLCKEILYNYVFNKSSVTSTAKNTKSYVNTYRAAALAVHLFSELGIEVLSSIIDMYRIQLSWNDYLIDDVDTIIPYERELQEAIDLISRAHPSALALLTARQRPPLVGVKLAARSLLYRILYPIGLGAVFSRH